MQLTHMVMLDLSLTVLYRLSFDCSCLCSNYISKGVVTNNCEGGYKTGGGGGGYPYKKMGGGWALVSLKGAQTVFG